MASDRPATPAGSSPDLEIPAELSRSRVRARLLIAAGVVLAVIVIVTLLPGLGGLRARLAHARPAWLVLGVGLKLLSGVGYVAAFRMIFCRRMSWRVSYQIGASELAADALLPTGGAGGLALGVWALRRGGMPSREIARRTVAFFLLTSVPNVLGVILLGFALAIGILGGEHNLLLTLAPALVAAAAVAAVLTLGSAAKSWGLRRQQSAEAAERPPSKAAGRVHRLVATVGEGVEEAVLLLREGNVILLLGLLAYLAFDVAILWATFRAIGASPPVAIVVLAYLIGELGGLIPVPGGLGGIDAGLVGTLVLYNVPLAPAAGAVLLYRAIALWVPTIVGGATFTLLRRRLRKEADLFAVCVPNTEMDIIGMGRVVRAPDDATQAST